MPSLQTPIITPINQSSTIQQISDITNSQKIQTQQFSHLIPYIIIILILSIILYIYKSRKSSSLHNTIALIGQRASGKTQLFIHLNHGHSLQTVPSIKNNITSYKSSSSSKQYQMIDYCGDNISKQQLLTLSTYSTIHTIIQVIDGTDSKKLGDVALFIYKLLINKHYQKRQTNFILFINKEDQQNFIQQDKIIKRLEDQIEHIKVSKKNNAEENQQEDDYIKTSKQRFDLRKTGIKVIRGAAKQGKIKLLQTQLENIL